MEKLLAFRTCQLNTDVL